MPENELNAIVSEPLFITSETMILRVRTDGWALPEFIPGQFAVLGLPGKAARTTISDLESEAPLRDKIIRRAYSITSSSRQSEYLEFYISLVRSGALTPRLFALKEGDRVLLGPNIRGLFTLDKIPDDSNLILIGTGTGVAPYISMIRTSLSANRKRKFTVIQGARHSWDLGFRSELSTLARLSKNFHYLPTISRPSEETIPWGGEVGYVQDIWSRGLIADEWGFEPTPENTHIFLCGHPNMITSTLALVEKSGFIEDSRKRKGMVHLERYW